MHRDEIDLLVDRFHAFERLLRDTYAAGGHLMVAFAEASQAQGLSPVVGHQIVSTLSTANSHACEALGSSAEAHRLLERLGRGLGLDVAAYGDGIKHPDGAFTTATGRLQVAA